MMQKLIESQGRQQIQKHNLQIAVSMQNKWRNRALGVHQHSKELSQLSKNVDDKLNGQQADLIKVKTSIEQISQKIGKLDLEINQAVSHLQNLN